MMYKNILVAIDGSSLSFKALEHAKVLAEATGGELLLLHVRNSAPAHTQHKRLGLITEAPEITEMDLMREFLDTMAGSSVKYKVRTETGNPAETIIEVVKEKKCDTIVMGSRGIGGLSKLFLGSVSSEVINNAEVPVVIVK